MKTTIEKENADEIRFGKRVIYWFIALSIVVGGILWFFHKTEDVAATAIINYEAFTDIYQTCQKLNTDLGNMESLSDTDRMFEQFSKAQRINAIKTKLNYWVEDYNAKSKMWNRSMWKSSSLPYQLQVTEFSNYK